MMPMSQLEAIVGALIMKERASNINNIDTLFSFENIDVINIKNKTAIEKNKIFLLSKIVL